MNTYAITLVESVGCVAGGAIVFLLGVLVVRGVRVHLYRHDDPAYRPGYRLEDDM